LAKLRLTELVFQLLVFQFGVPSLLDGTQVNSKSIFQLINYIQSPDAKGDGILESQLRQAEDVVCNLMKKIAVYIMIFFSCTISKN
jgi:hypothetical protein